MSNCYHFWRSFDKEPHKNVEIVYICKAFRKIRDNSNLILDLSIFQFIVMGTGLTTFLLNVLEHRKNKKSWQA